MNIRHTNISRSLNNLFYKRSYAKYLRICNAIDMEMIFDQVLENPDESGWTSPEYINKGFALLSIDKSKYKYAAIEAFEAARRLDINSEYSKEIKCGFEQTSDEVKGFTQLALKRT